MEVLLDALFDLDRGDIRELAGGGGVAEGLDEGHEAQCQRHFAVVILRMRISEVPLVVED